MPYCKALHNHLHVSVSGHYNPCCVYNSTKTYHVNNYSPEEYLNSDDHKNVIENMHNGWDPGCINCKTKEDSGLRSYRQIVEDNYCTGDHGILEYVEVSASNKCNIRCRMCGPWASSKWEETLDESVPDKILDFESLLDSIDASQLRVLKYLGGEPFITPEIKNIFDWSKSISQKFKFYFNTNLTLFPHKYIDDLLHFEKLIIGYSIDGIESVNNYIRQDSDWETCFNNFKLWEELKTIKNNTTYIHTTVQAYNFHQLSKIKQLCDEYELQHSAFTIDSPVEFTLNALPEKYIDKYIDDYNSKFLKNYRFDNALFEKLKETTIKNDKLFGTDICVEIPEFKDILWT